MNVVIPIVSASRHISGVQQHSLNLARCLLGRAEIAEVHLVGAPHQGAILNDSVLPADARLSLHFAPMGASATDRNLWYYLRLPKLAAELNADIVHYSYPAPLNADAFHCQTVVTLHDLYPYDIPGNFGYPQVFVNRLVLRQSLLAADAIACVSQSTLSRLSSFDRVLAEKTARVIPNCVERHTSVSAESPVPNWRGEPFLLCVAQHRTNKNLLFLLRVFAQILDMSKLPPETRLVIVGIEGPETRAILRFIDANRIAEQVVLLHGISRDELEWCYRKCRLLVAPSVIEGFGLPVAEALLAGCHVICSDIPAFREVGGDRCHYIPLDTLAQEAFVDAIHAAFSQPSPRPTAIPHLSAPVVAEECWRLYRSLLFSGASAKALPVETRASKGILT